MVIKEELFGGSITDHPIELSTDKHASLQDCQAGPTQLFDVAREQACMLPPALRSCFVAVTELPPSQSMNCCGAVPSRH